MDAVESLKEKMVLACKVLQNRGVVDVYGHVSARLPGDRILSTPHMPPGKVALRDLIVLDMQGKKLEGFRGPTAASVTSVSRKTLSSGTILGSGNRQELGQSRLPARTQSGVCRIAENRDGTNQSRRKRGLVQYRSRRVQYRRHCRGRSNALDQAFRHGSGSGAAAF